MANRSSRARRANGEGSITQRDDGALIVRVTDPTTGKRIKRIVARAVLDDGRAETPAQHRKRADAALGQLRADLARPAALRERWTVDRYAREQYLPSLVETTKPYTRFSYRKELDLYVFPHVGGIELSKLTVDDVDRLDRLLTEAGYSLTVRRKARGVLGRVLRYAVRKGRLTLDVTANADPLARDDRDRTKDALEPEQVRALLTAARGTEWEAAVVLLGLLGLRRGEVLGLAWESVDLAAGTLTVARNMVTLDAGEPSLGAPKTKGSGRTLNLSVPAVGVLKAQRVRQAEHALAAGRYWSGTFHDDHGDQVALVFTDEAGRPLPAHRLNDALTRFARTAGIDARVTPHVLRHSAASLMIAEGMDIAAVAAVLGHASPAVTTSVYAHALRRTQARATAVISEAVGQW
jgi:integrase